jgi:hypothetical protein
VGNLVGIDEQYELVRARCRKSRGHVRADQGTLAEGGLRVLEESANWCPSSLGCACPCEATCGSIRVMDANDLIRRCNDRSLDELAPFQGQWVAWSDDGREILANAPDLDNLFQVIDRKGLTRYVLDHVAPPDEDFIGGMAF